VTATLWLATGGTGGHVFPALALAQEAVAAGWRVTLIGGARGPERGWAEAAGVPFIGVSAGKLDRGRPSPRSLAAAGWGVLQSAARIGVARPDLLIGFGGYASLPGVAAAWLTGTPFVLHETNATPGLVTRTFARRARLVLLTQAEASARLRGAQVAVLPLPVRERRVPRSEARARWGIAPDALLTLVMGGSQGSSYLNATVPKIAARLSAEEPRLVLLHQTGHGRSEEVRAWYPPAVKVHVSDFVDAAEAFAAADLAVTRGGFGTIADAAFHGVPLLVVPLPSAADDHQRHNALALAAAGAGAWAAEGDEAAIEAAWRSLLDPLARARAAAAALQRSPEGGARAVLTAIAPLARRRPGGDAA
jgi:UDP-N-acetylglucosamine--N-acetylmuramyl-(pentapeptide) pyrophosphoryl-undecaprenol N-acetylglucosamine transferase